MYRSCIAWAHFSSRAQRRVDAKRGEFHNAGHSGAGTDWVH